MPISKQSTVIKLSDYHRHDFENRFFKMYTVINKILLEFFYALLMSVETIADYVLSLSLKSLVPLIKYTVTRDD